MTKDAPRRPLWFDSGNSDDTDDGAPAHEFTYLRSRRLRFTVEPERAPEDELELGG